MVTGMLAAAFLLTATTATAFTASFEHFKDQNSYEDGKFLDVSAKHWAAEHITRAYESGLMTGVSKDAFNPEGTVTVAQAVVVASRIHSTYRDNGTTFASATPWYQPYLDYAQLNGICGDVTLQLNDPITRDFFVQLMANALPAEAFEEINTVADNAIPDLLPSAPYAPAVFAFYRAGILTGTAGGYFSPDQTISRGEASAIISRVVDPALRVSDGTKAEDAVKLEINFDWMSTHINERRSFFLLKNTDEPIKVGIDNPNQSAIDFVVGPWDKDNTCLVTVKSHAKSNSHITFYAADVDKDGKLLYPDARYTIQVEVSGSIAVYDDEEKPGPDPDPSEDKWQQYLDYKAIIDKRIADIRAEGSVYMGTEDTYKRQVDSITSDLLRLQILEGELIPDSSFEAKAQLARVRADIERRQGELDELNESYSRKTSIDALKASLQALLSNLLLFADNTQRLSDVQVYAKDVDHVLAKDTQDLARGVLLDDIPESVLGEAGVLRQLRHLHIGGGGADVWVKARARGRHQVCGQVLHGEVGVLGQEGVDVALDALHQRGVRGAVVIGAGGHARVVAIGLGLIGIGVVIIGRGTAAHEAGVGEVLAHKCRTHGLPVGVDQTAVGLMGEDELAHAGHQQGVDKAADHQQDQGDQQGRF